MGELFKTFGIAIGLLFIDAAVCVGIIELFNIWNDDDWWLLPLIVNTLCFVTFAAIYISEKIG